MLVVVCSAFFLPFILAQDLSVKKCIDEVKVKSVMMEKGGVSYSKLVVDTDSQITINFPLNAGIEIRDLDWKLNDHPVDVDEDDKRSAIYWMREPENIVLVIRVPKLQYIGTWQVTIEAKGQEKSIQSCELHSPPLVQRFVESFRSTEGYEMEIVCKSASMPPPTKISWFRVDGSGDQATLISMDNIKKTHIEGDTLVFKEVKMSDTGSYICNTTAPGGISDSSVAEVKIKSRFSALWPFIGILAELIILMVTIILYERHKASKKKTLAQNDLLLAAPVSPSGDIKSQHSVRA